MTMLAGATQLDDSPRIRSADRRRGMRVRQARPVKVHHAAAGRYLPGRTLDVSATGLKVELPASAAVSPGTLVNIHVGLSDQGSSLANRRTMMPARVVWVERIPSGRAARVGLEFVTSLDARRDAA